MATSLNRRIVALEMAYCDQKPLVLICPPDFSADEMAEWEALHLKHKVLRHKQVITIVTGVERRNDGTDLA